MKAVKGKSGSGFCGAGLPARPRQQQELPQRAEKEKRPRLGRPPRAGEPEPEPEEEEERSDDDDECITYARVSEWV